MLNQKQRRFLEAYLEESTIEKAVKRAGIAKSTGYKYLDDPVFKKELSEQRKRIMNTLTSKLQKHGESAVDVLGQNLSDPEGTVSTKNHTAKIILDFIYKNHEMENIIERLDEVERMLDNDNR